MDLPPDVVLIAGTGIEDWAPDGEEVAFETPYGRVTGRLARMNARRVLLLQRHAAGHSVPPHLVNFRAIISAIGMSGCTQVIGTAAVGAVRADIEVGRLVVIDDVLDFTHGRDATFVGPGTPVRHVDVTYAYCRRLCGYLREALSSLPEKDEPGVVYATTNGPRYETPAEIRALGRLGADVVGMTQAPEVFLARERGLCYAAVAIVTNAAASRDAGRVIEESKVMESLKESGKRFRALFLSFLDRLPRESAPCPSCAFNAPIFPS